MTDMPAVWNHKWTALTLLTAGFSAWVGIGIAVDPDPTIPAGGRAFWALLMLVGALTVLAGLWLIRSGVHPVVGSAAVGLGVIPAGTIFWILLPTIAAIAIIVGGVVLGGLRRELSVAPEASAPAAAA
jgi:hypothetical protein